jgi:hypothetical protein
MASSALLARSISHLKSSGTVPTLIAFFGWAPSYVELALRSAANCGNRVVLLGDETNHGVWKDHCDSSRMRLEKFAQFQTSFQKMSDYGDGYEMAFWRRPFVIEEWMVAEGVQRAFVLDGDVLTFADYSKDVLPSLPSGCAAALMTYEDQGEFDWATSLHFSYWTLDALRDFTSFCIEAYRDPTTRKALETKYRWHLEHRQPGGICEMTLLFLWRQRIAATLSNLAAVWDDKTADLAIGASANSANDEYPMQFGLKRFAFRDGIPFAHNRHLNLDIRFVSIHCQGRYKSSMRFLSRPALRRLYVPGYFASQAVSSTYTLAATFLKRFSG